MAILLSIQWSSLFIFCLHDIIKERKGREDEAEKKKRGGGKSREGTRKYIDGDERVEREDIEQESRQLTDQRCPVCV